MGTLCYFWTLTKKKKKEICFIGTTFHLVSALGCSCCKEKKALNWIWASVYNVRVSFFVLRWCTVWTACKEFEICRVITRHGWHTFSEYWSERSGTLYLTDTHLSRVSSPACFVWCAVQSVGSHDHSLNGTSPIVLTRSLKKNLINSPLQVTMGEELEKAWYFGVLQYIWVLPALQTGSHN